MVLGLATKLFGSSNERTLRQINRLVPQIAAFEATLSALSDAELQAQTPKLKEKLAQGATLDDILPEAFATVREAAKRVLGQRHYDVQLVGGMVLHRGQIAEMRTGEGKTLVATLPVYLNALSGKGVHVVTVNDYLAKRDSDWMGQVYRFLGMSVGCIVANIPDAVRRAAYQADITYGTNNEFGFDYLRDNMKYKLEDMVQRPFNFAIVDEVDSILIDEARTPLIISGPAEDSTDLYSHINKLIPALIADPKNFEKDEKVRTVNLTDTGVEAAEQAVKAAGLLHSDNMYDSANIAVVHHLNQALRAHVLFRRDVDYIVKDGKVIIIDEFTGRMMEGRRYSDGLHQALEAKEGVAVENENQTLASITFQNYFRMYPKLAGMTGTARTEEAEFGDIYNLSVVEIPTNRGVARVDSNDRIYKSHADKIKAITELIKECQGRQQPVLVGTTSIEKSEQLSAELRKLKVPHQVLNARYHEQEAHIVAQAGRLGAVTIATNMAGRGTDIQLGGNFEMRVEQEVPHDADEPTKARIIADIKAQIEADREKVRAAGGLYIIGTERHESRRIDNQLRGRSGRQGDPGASVFFLSLEDDLMRIFGAERLEPLLAHRRIGLKEGEALSHPLISKTLEKAQNKVEQQNFEIRKNLLKFDNVMNDQRKVVYEQRREIMRSDDVSAMITDMRHDVLENLCAVAMPEGSFPEQWDLESLQKSLHRLFRTELPLKAWAAEEGISTETMTERVVDETDKIMAHKVAQFGADSIRRFERSVLLQQLDHHWKEHLLTLDHLRQGINLRAFAQRDPLNEYKTDAFMLFSSMMAAIKDSVTETLGVIEAVAQPVAPAVDLSKLVETRVDPALEADTTQADTTVTPFQHQKLQFDPQNPATWESLNRNALCPCGSGKKYKHCHGSLQAHG